MKKNLSESNFEYISIHNIIKENNLILLQQIILQEKITMDYKDIYQNSLLHIAVSYNNYNVCKYLVENKINLNTINIWNMTPLQQAIHMNHDNISSLLRNNKAYYKNKLDSEQIIFGDRDDFFEKITLCIENLYQFFPNYCSINFFHNTYNSEYLFCCSKHETKDPSFHNYISHFILSKHLYFIKQPQCINIDTIKKQEDFIFLPYCSIYDIKQVIIIPLEINNILIGYFFVWNTEKTENIKISIFQKLFQKIMVSQFFFILQYSYESYIFNIQKPLVQNFLEDCCKIIEQKDSDYDLHISILYFLDNCQAFWSKIKEDFYFKKLVKIVIYYQKALIPYGSLYKIYTMNQNIYKKLKEEILFQKEELPFESFCKKQLPLIHFHTTHKNESHETLSISDFDYYKVIGKELSKEKIKELNDIYEKICLKEPYTFDIYSFVNQIISGKNSIREDEVVGIQNKFKNTFFVFSNEVEESLDIVFKNVILMENKLSQVYYLFYTISQYIHPFLDGNGRTCRLVATFYMKKMGYDVCISKMEKIISFQDFLKKVNSL
jgi:hypothetical protein